MVLAADTPLLFDFGTPTSPVAAGYQRVAANTAYSAARGFGWSSGTIYNGDRGGTALAARDFNHTRDGTFTVNLANGRYQVDLMLGDLGGYRHDQAGVYLEGDLRDSVTTNARQVVTRSFQVDVFDGALTLRLRDLGGSDVYAVIESLEIRRLGSIVPALQASNSRVIEGADGNRQLLFDVTLSKPTDRDVSAVYQTANGTALADEDYASAAGTLTIAAGRTQGTIAVSVFGDETIESDETVLLQLSSPDGAVLATSGAFGQIINDDYPPALGLALSLGAVRENAPGVATLGTITRTGPTRDAVSVLLSAGDPASIAVPQSVEFGAGMSSATFEIRTVDNSLVDGRRTVAINASAQGLVATSTTLVVNDDEQPPFAAYFDFGTTGSPLTAGYNRISEKSTCSAALGFGWTAGQILTGDRGTASTLTRDFNYTTDATFVVNVAGGNYYVDLLLGDTAGYAHDQVGVFLEGASFDVVSTAGGQVVARSYLVNVADGQLTLRLRDLGGADKWAVVEALRVRSADAPAPVPAFWPAVAGIPNALFTAATRDADGFLTYTVNSPYQRTANSIRVLLPTNYNAAYEYDVVYVLPVGPGLDRGYGDGLLTARNLNLHNVYNTIFAAPSFSEIPWYADSATTPSISEESYFTKVVVPFVESQFHTPGTPDGRLLLGFSKSGYGAVSMLLRNPEYFGRAVAWDSGLAMTDPGAGTGFLGVLGTRQNFTANYQITNLIPQRAAAFAGDPARFIIMGNGNSAYFRDAQIADAVLTSAGIAHRFLVTPGFAHNWSSGWFGTAVQSLLATPA